MALTAGDDLCHGQTAGDPNGQATEKSAFLMVNQLFLWQCSIVLLNYQRVLYRVLLSPQ